MKRYSIAPSSSRRKSTIKASFGEDTAAAREELERLEQETTLVLQEIDKNISRGNAIINDRLIPIIKDYSVESKKVWDNAGFWKFFFEQSANVELNSYEDPINLNTELNTITNARNNLFNDDDNDEEDSEVEIDHNENNKDIETGGGQFLKPISKPIHIEEETPTWSTEQSKVQQQQQQQLLQQQRQIQSSSTPQLHKRPSSLLPEYNKLAKRYDSNDSLGIQNPPSLTAIDSSNSPIKKRSSPGKVQTIRQSLDSYHRVSISPKKSWSTPAKTDLEHQNNKRSSMIQELLSSPTLPEPPVLQSELGNYPSSSSSSHRSTSKSQEPIDAARFSPILVESVFSPEKRKRQSASPQKSRENTVQRFPTTPKFAERLSGGGSSARAGDRANTPLQLRFGTGDEEDSDIQPPELQNIALTTTTDTSSDRNPGLLDNIPIPELEPVDSRKRFDESVENSAHKRSRLLDVGDDDDNVFLDNVSNKSAGSTIYHSLTQKETNQSRDNTNHSHQSQSRSLSQVFDDVISRIANRSATSPAAAAAAAAHEAPATATTSTEVHDLFKEVTSTLDDSTTQLDNTENTGDLGPLQQRWRNINGKD
ncbi:DASH complex subunit ask1 [Scheffersomyces coipomensis]|uniref:DASH complex subunit ask1 n=1 Tax=Scheffersomyces coipomensis TaxID=1788519 RepID=UPI00315CDA0C